MAIILNYLLLLTNKKVAALIYFKAATMNMSIQRI